VIEVRHFEADCSGLARGRFPASLGLLGSVVFTTADDHAGAAGRSSSGGEFPLDILSPVREESDNQALQSTVAKAFFRAN